MTLPDLISFVLAVATLPGAVWFIALYAHDGWTRHWFGRSLMAIAVAVLVSCGGAIMFRIFGMDYPGREWVGVVVWSLACFGMWTRALVLRAAQRADVPPRRTVSRRH